MSFVVVCLDVFDNKALLFKDSGITLLRLTTDSSQAMLNK